MQGVTLDIASRATWAPGEGQSQPACLEIPAMLRRRLSHLSRVAAHLGTATLDGQDIAASEPMLVLASRHGEIEVLSRILAQIHGREPVSPTHFSNSVHHTALGHISLVHGNRNAARAVSAGDRTWEAGWLEAFCMAQANPRGSVLLIFAEDVFPEGFLGQTRFQAESGRGEAFLLCPVGTAKQPLGRVRLDAAAGEAPFDREVLDAWISDRNRQNLRVPLAGGSLSFDPIYPEPARLLPHKAPMVLLDEIVSVGEQRACSRVSIRPGIPFRRNGEVSSLTGIEYFAQTVAALAGWEQYRMGGEPRLGFLISVRDFRCELPAFPDGTQLLVEVVHAWGDQELMRFDGRILDADTGSVLAQGVINVFGPDNPGSFLESE